MGDGENKKPARFPAPQISDLLVLTLCASVVFAFNAPGYQDGFKLYVIEWHDLLPNLLDEFVTSFCMFGLIVLLRQNIRRADSPLAPGHVAILTIGPFEVFGLILNVFRPLLLINDRLKSVDSGLCAAVFAASLCYPLVTIRKLELWWRVCLYLLVLSLAFYSLARAVDAAIYAGLAGIFYRRHMLAMIGNFDSLVLLTASVAVAIDLRCRKRRDWLHHVGVVVLAAYSAAAMMHWGQIMSLWWQALYNRIAP